ncbi:hypothetical protein CDL12_24013 [Handroanthus impetiginosus]|uniref:Bifunctional inhibitor/plant lipid transfer protein/seed storage helical domain-containing protein n=1 Tax=Handroanthus impetiginosus TaxID=429701 RepID=A0A2G9GDW4_9LAMI|nr:hypothetical protein CDL12_24012 [Handroanthus impetiginosus]PIN03470.1 hypothetical protein CDL12_24013 [Handroanthus impetiginosus]
MSKSLALAAALLVALIALAGATRYSTTVITTAVDDEPSPGQFQQCLQQIQGRQFRSCQRYLSEQEVIENPREQSLRDCCQQLRNVNENCRCEAVRQAVRQLQQGGGSGQQMEKMQEVYQKASNLPSRCGFRQQLCQFRAVFV